MSEPTSIRAAYLCRFSLVILVCYWLAMFAGTHWPRLNLSAFPTNFDKVLHFGAYAGLSFLLAVWLSSRREIGRRELLLIFVATVVYAALDEITQPPFGRTCDFYDGVADAAGSLTGLFVFLPLRHAMRRLAATYRGAASAAEEEGEEEPQRARRAQRF